MAVDRLGMAGGWNPNVGFASHMGKRPDWCDTLQAFKQDKLPGGMMFAGAADGALSLADAMASGEAAARRVSDTETVTPRIAVSAQASPHVVSGSSQKSFVDFQHDVTVDDILLADREGYRSVEHLKRYTTLGMATDQGKAGQILGHAVLAQHRGTRSEEHTSELQSLLRISYAVFCLKKKNIHRTYISLSYSPL